MRIRLTENPPIVGAKKQGIVWNAEFDVLAYQPRKRFHGGTIFYVMGIKGEKMGVLDRECEIIAGSIQDLREVRGINEV